MPSGIYKHKSGKEATAYIDGRCSSKIYYCIELVCNNQISYENYRNGNGRCKPCAGKIHSKRQRGEKNSFYNKRHTFKHKQKMSLSQGGTGIPYEFNKYPMEFYKIRNKILKRDNYICQKCNKYGNCVHHIDYKKNNNQEDNLICLCKRCNLIINANRKYWTKYFTMTHVSEQCSLSCPSGKRRKYVLNGLKLKYAPCNENLIQGGKN